MGCCGAVSRSYLQLEGLTWKNILLLKSSLLSLLGIIIIPSCFMFAFMIPIDFSGSNASDFELGPFDSEIITFSKCVTRNVHNQYISASDNECVSVLYSPNTGVPAAILDIFTERNELVAGTDIIGFADFETMATYMEDNLGKFGVAVTFEDALSYGYDYNSDDDYGGYYESDDFDFGDLVSNENDTSGISYYMLQNESMPEVVMGTKLGLDASILQYYTGKTTTSWEWESQRIPWYFEYFIDKYPDDTVWDIKEDETGEAYCGHDFLYCAGGSVIMTLPFAVVAVSMMGTVTKEKKEQLLQTMRMMGLNDWIYWLSWLVSLFMISGVTAGLSTIIGYFTDVDIFTKAPITLVFPIIWLFCTSMGSMGMFFSSFVSRPRWANALAFIFIAATYITSLLMGFSSYVVEGATLTSFGTALYSPSASGAYSTISSALPWFHYTKIYTHILSESTTFNFTDSEYTWDSFTAEITVPTSDCEDYPSCCADGYCFDVPTDSQSVVNILILTVVYTFLAWYFGQIAGSGAHLRPWFLFTAKYWHCGRKQKFQEGDRIDDEQKASLNDQSVRLWKVSKTFDNTTAVRELSLEMKTNELTVILGHNGAGKSTTINMLNGNTELTFGNAFIFGHSVRDEMYKIRTLLGTCPQDNVLWKTLSAEQHLTVMGKIRGLSGKKLKKKIRKKLRAFALTDVKDIPSSAMSGGMKRRLSMCIASIGEPHLLFLDEPTTGLDPLSKHRAWEAIRELKKDKVVLMTTHSMEEADALGDRIAIMNGGQLRAHGTSLFLKNHFGSGYQVQLLSSPASLEIIKPNIRKLLPEASIISEDAGNVTIGLPRRALVNFPVFYRWVKSHSVSEEEYQTLPENAREGKLVLKGWSFSNSTLEEVFLRLCSGNKVVEQGDGGAEVIHMCLICQKRQADTVTLFTKAGIEVQIPDFVCEPCAEGLSHSMEEISESIGSAGELDLDDTSEEEEEKLATKTSSGVTHTNYVKKKSLSSSIDLGVDKEAGEPKKKAMFEQRSKPNILTLFFMQTRAVFLKDINLKLHQRKAYIGKLVVAAICLFFTVVAFASTSLCPEGYVKDTDYFGETGCVISFTHYSSYFDFDTWTNNENWYWDEEAFENKVEYNYFNWFDNDRNTFDETDTFWYIDSTVDGDLTLKAMNVDKNGDNTTDTVQDIFVLRSTDLTGMFADQSARWEAFPEPEVITSDSMCYQYWWEENNDGDPQKGIILDDVELFAAVPAFMLWIQQADGDTMEFKFRHLSPRLNGWDDLGSIPLFNLRQDTWGDEFYNETNTWCNGLYSELSTTEYNTNLLLASHQIMNLLLNKEYAVDTRVGTRLVSLPNVEYATTVSSFDVAKSLVAFTVIGLMLFPDAVARVTFEMDEGLFFAMRVSGMKFWMYWAGNYASDMFTMCIWGAAFVMLSYFFGSATFANSDIIKFISVLFLGNHAIIGFGYALSVLFKKETHAAMLSYVLILVASILTVLFGFDILGDTAATVGNFIPIMAYARAFGVVLSGDQYYSEEQVEEHFNDSIFYLAVMGFVYLFLAMAGHYIRHDAGFKFLEKTPNLDAAVQSNDQSSDVLEEIDRVRKNRDLPVRILGLKKIYGGSSVKVAVNDLYLGVNYGECFGLLGPNGAGKSTSLNVLSCVLRPSAGKVEVAGFDISDREDIFSVLGVCPQFDIVWDNLTVEQHLNFYSRLKCVPLSKERGWVREMAEMVQLDGDSFNKGAGTLSGGQRRRLAIAISLIGNPKIWLLDEPSTGLSPEARRQIWNIVNEQRRYGRAVIITTHSMEEADTLCNRIGIMAAAKLRAIGTPAYLKDKYGKGLHLTLILDESIEEDIVEKSAEDDAEASVTVKPAKHAPKKRATELLKVIQRDFCETAELVEFFGDSVTFLLPRSGIDEQEGVLTIFETLESHSGHFKKKHGINEWGIAQTSLDEVFIKTVEEAEAMEAANQ